MATKGITRGEWVNANAAAVFASIASFSFQLVDCRVPLTNTFSVSIQCPDETTAELLHENLAHEDRSSPPGATWSVVRSGCVVSGSITPQPEVPSRGN